MYRYLVVIEDAGENFSAYAPDVPGCVATGSTVGDTLKNMEEALQVHLRGMLEDGDPPPEDDARAVAAVFVSVDPARQAGVSDDHAA